MAHQKDFIDTPSHFVSRCKNITSPAASELAEYLFSDLSCVLGLRIPVACYQCLIKHIQIGYDENI